MEMQQRLQEILKSIQQQGNVTVAVCAAGLTITRFKRLLLKHNLEKEYQTILRSKMHLKGPILQVLGYVAQGVPTTTARELVGITSYNFYKGLDMFQLHVEYNKAVQNALTTQRKLHLEKIEHVIQQLDTGIDLKCALDVADITQDRFYTVIRGTGLQDRYKSSMYARKDKGE